MKAFSDVNNQDPTVHAEILSAHPSFSYFSKANLDELLSQCTIDTFEADEVITREGDLVNTVYFILKGKCEVQKQSGEGQSLTNQPIATLSEGESIGLSQIGLFSSTGARTATVKALSHVTLLHLDITKLQDFLKGHPNLNEAFSNQLEMLLRMHFIKSVAPFTSLTNPDIRRIADKIDEITLSAGETIFTQGDHGDACFIIKSGKVSITVQIDDGTQMDICELTTNAVIGESALILDAPRNATATTTAPTTLLRIDQILFKEILKEKTSAADALMKLQFSRSRPTRRVNIDVYSQTKQDGSTVTILRDTKLGKYHQLSNEGMFIWELLDGQSSINDITLRYYLKYKAFNPKAVSVFLINLHNAGFIHLEVNERLTFQDQKIPLWLNALSKIRSVMEYRLTFGNADDWISKAYAGFAWIFYTRLAHACWLFISTFGFIAFCSGFPASVDLLSVSPNKWELFILSFFLTALTVPLHELTHAFTTKYYGRKVYCFGVGWLWFGPFAFCDTSDMWLSPPKERVAVDLAGIYFNIILAGLAGFAALASAASYPTLSIIFELFALSSYLIVVANLSPVIELDGYYALMDYLDKPNLRVSAVKWLITLTSRKKINNQRLGWANIKTNHKEASYWAATIIFIIVNNILVPYVVLTYLFHGLLGTQNPWLSIAMASLVLIITALSLYKEVLKVARTA